MLKQHICQFYLSDQHKLLDQHRFVQMLTSNQHRLPKIVGFCWFEIYNDQIIKNSSYFLFILVNFGVFSKCSKNLLKPFEFLKNLSNFFENILESFWKSFEIIWITFGIYKNF